MVRRPLRASQLLALRDLRRDRVFSIVIVLVSMLITALLATTVGGMLTNNDSQRALYDRAQSSDAFIRFTGAQELDDEVADLAATPGVDGVDTSVSIAVTASAHDEEATLNLTSVDDLEPGTSLDSDALVSDRDVILPNSAASALGLSTGDEFTVDSGVEELTLRLVGTFDDPVFGSPMMGYKRAVLSSDAFDALLADTQASSGQLALVTLVTFTVEDGADQPSAEDVLGDLDWVGDAEFAYDSSFIMRTYAIIPGIVSAVLLVTAVALGLILVFVLRHVSSVLLRREWRNSGVLKVLGMSTGQIRMRLGTRLVALSTLGALLGAMISVWTIPALGRVYLATNGLSSMPVVVRWPLLGSVAVVVGLVCVTAVFSTRVLTRLNPRAALDSQMRVEGRRWPGPSLGSLVAAPIRIALTLKDVLRAPGRYLSLGVTALVFSFLMGALVPLGSAFATRDRVIELLGLDAYDVTATVVTQTDRPGEVFDAALSSAVADVGLDNPTYVAAHRAANVRIGGRTVVATVSDDFPDSLRIAEGRLPANDREILLASGLASSIDAAVGDEVEIDTGRNGATSYEVVGLYDTVNQAGLTMWLGEDAFQRLVPSEPSPYYYVAFESPPDETQVAELVDSLNEQPGISATAGRAQVSSVVSMVQLALRGVVALVTTIGVLLASVVTLLLAMSAIAADRRTYAIMATLGYGRGQLRITTASGFALTATVAALLGGLLARVAAEPLLVVLLSGVGLSAIDLPAKAVGTVLIAVGCGALSGASAWLAARTLPRVTPGELSSE